MWITSERVVTWTDSKKRFGENAMDELPVTLVVGEYCFHEMFDCKRAGEWLVKNPLMREREEK